MTAVRMSAECQVCGAFGDVFDVPWVMEKQEAGCTVIVVSVEECFELVLSVPEVEIGADDVDWT